MRPGVHRYDRGAEYVPVAIGPVAPHAWNIALVGGRHEVVAVDVLVDDRAPPDRRRGREDPRLERHRGGQAKRRRIGDRDLRTRAVEHQRIAEFARGPGRSARNAVVVLAGGVADCRPRSFVESIRRDQAAGIRSQRGDRYDARPGTQIACGVGGAYPVTVGGRRRQADVAIARARGRRDRCERGASGAKAALQDVAGHSDVVGGSSPTQVDLACADSGRGQSGGRGGRGEVRRRRRGRGDGGVAASVAAASTARTR